MGKYTVITGAAGFIGSCLLSRLNIVSDKELVIVDAFEQKGAQIANLADKRWALKIEREAFLDWFQENSGEVEMVYHIGARTDTTEFDKAIFDQLNVSYSKRVWEICSLAGIPLIYASSAATYGLGEQGYNDAHTVVDGLQPLNPYGWSKQEFDQWVLQQQTAPPFWAGLKFFNVYGPNEYHKGRMASVVFHAFNQITKSGQVKLFRSHRPDFADGAQSRDFIYVMDVVDVIEWLSANQPTSGLYNLGTGEARPFLDLATSTFTAMGREPKIVYIDTPEDIRETYQYFTEAEMGKLREVGYSAEFTSLEAGITEYVQRFLLSNRHY